MNHPTITWITADHPQLDQIIAMVHHATQHEASRCLQSADIQDTFDTIKATWQAELNDGHLIIGTTQSAVLAAEFHFDRAWLRGPFGNRAHAPILWHALVQQLPAHVTTYDAFPHLNANEMVVFWQTHGFHPVKTVHVMHHSAPVVDALTSGVTRATDAHRTAIDALHQQHFAHTWASIHDLYADDALHLLSVATTADDIVKGYAWWSIDTLDCSATLEFIAVHETYQRTGVASNLLYHGLAWAYSHRVNYVQLTVDDERCPVQALYQRFGFRYKSSGLHLRWHTPKDITHV